MLTQNKIENPDKLPEISIIMPTYNRANLISRAIKSVLNQTFKNIELIIVDDASTDNTEDVVRSFNDKRIIYIKHRENRKPPAALNTALDAVKGKYMMALMDDDEFTSDAAQTIVDKFAELSPKGIKILWFDCIDAETREYSGSGIRKEGYVPYEDNLCDKISGDYLCVLDTQLIDNNRFGEAFWNMPSLFTLKFYRNNKVYYTPKTLEIAYRNHGQDRISKPASSFSHIESIVLQEKFFMKEYGQEVKHFCPDFYGRKLAVLGMYQILNNEKKEGRKNILESFKFHFSPANYYLFILSFILNSNQLKNVCVSFFRMKGRITGILGKFVKPIIHSNV